ncbi:hypothetical protein TSUD_222510 [Trifolium subterraneum]|uniref:Aminotransferase-like plant mobile domain-containing protein n=1 Tax=Trifolium subterraneum TaxID=3900 RepID=A0A2Z6M6K1_TRISU|nr:hypothetical protein TSUD_222510 [Trifolium subterraneum]
MTDKYYYSYLRNSAKNIYDITPFEYTNSCFYTKEFSEWWERHYSSHLINEQVLLLRLTVGFIPPVNPRARSKTTSAASNKPTTSQANQETKGRKREGTSTAGNASKKAKKEDAIVLSDDEMVCSYNLM